MITVTKSDPLASAALSRIANRRVELSSRTTPYRGYWVRDINGPFACFCRSYSDAEAISKVFVRTLHRWLSDRLTVGEINTNSIALARLLTEDPNKVQREQFAEREPIKMSWDLGPGDEDWNNS